ncbi:DCC1-like thiol-disulfide oxidoreductase family protein [Methylolobus aquaticus]
MFPSLLNAVRRGLTRPVPAIGLGWFRLFFALVVLGEVLFLYYFRHLIFDPVPYLDIASPSVHLFLVFWGVTAACLALGYHTRAAAVLNYAFWLVFTVFTPMWKDFDGGFDQLMLGSSFLLMFLPSERALSLDNLRLKWKLSHPGQHYRPPEQVSVLAYYIPLLLSLGLIYFDSAIHKLSAEFWRNGLGPWLPSSLPYYMSALDMSPLLEIEPLQRAFGYAILAFQFLFPFTLYFRPFRLPLLLMGIGLHGGIILSLNIYPFGFGMLVHYFLLVPLGWWRRMDGWLRVATPGLTVYYDEQCPLCNRTAIFVEHFDIRRAVAFRGLQTHARDCAALAGIPEAELLKDLYAVDRGRRVVSGLDTYIRILQHMGYTAPLALMLRLPGLYQLAARVYRQIADTRARLVCDAGCALGGSPLTQATPPWGGLIEHLAPTDRQKANRIAKFLVMVLVLQLNCTIHYAILYRIGLDPKNSEAGQIAAALSNGLITLSHTFLGITPHALYLHDHFEGYEHILALTYIDDSGEERWLPFIDEQGRMLAPYWGRVHSMWANVAVTRNIEHRRLRKFVEKVTAYLGGELGISLTDRTFVLKLKEVRAPMHWVADLRQRNLGGAWRTVGRAVWHDGQMRLDLYQNLGQLSRGVQSESSPHIAP